MNYEKKYKDILVRLEEAKNVNDVCDERYCCVMTEEEVRAKMQEGFAKIQPKVAEMTSIIIDAYQEGFKTCWELLTGQKFK